LSVIRHSLVRFIGFFLFAVSCSASAQADVGFLHNFAELRTLFRNSRLLNPEEPALKNTQTWACGISTPASPDLILNATGAFFSLSYDQSTLNVNGNKAGTLDSEGCYLDTNLNHICYRIVGDSELILEASGSYNMSEVVPVPVPVVDDSSWPVLGNGTQYGVLSYNSCKKIVTPVQTSDSVKSLARVFEVATLPVISDLHVGGVWTCTEYYPDYLGGYPFLTEFGTDGGPLMVESWTPDQFPYHYLIQSAGEFETTGENVFYHFRKDAASSSLIIEETSLVDNKITVEEFARCTLAVAQ
jgi:hypothetical protein